MGGTFLYQARVETAGFQRRCARCEYWESANPGGGGKAQAVQHTRLAQTIDQAHQGRGGQTKIDLSPLSWLQ